VVVGTSCSGKTTFSRKLAAKTKIPYLELDQLHWMPNWQEKDDVDFRQDVRQKIDEHPCWIMDGNYKVVRDLTWGAASVVIWLNYPFWLVFSRAISRTVSRVFTQKPLFHNNRESFHRAFLSTESIIFWVLKTYKRRKKQYKDLMQQSKYQHILFIEFNSPKQAAFFLQNLYLK